MNVLITYDIFNLLGDSPGSKNIEVKNGMLKLEYLDHYIKNDTNYYLPNTTLWKPNTSPEQAKRDLESVAILTNASIIRLFACELTASFVGIEGKPYLEHKH